MIYYLEAFYRLSERRSSNFGGFNPISLSDIKAYLDLYPTHDIDLFLYLITEMDAEYLSIKNKSNG